MCDYQKQGEKLNYANAQQTALSQGLASAGTLPAKEEFRLSIMQADNGFVLHLNTSAGGRGYRNETYVANDSNLRLVIDTVLTKYNK